MNSRIVAGAVYLLTAAFLFRPAMGQVHDPRALSADPATATSPIAPVLDGLGDHHIDVTTSNERSQYFFDQGFRLTLGFNHSEALRAFKEAVRLDPDNAMAYWGWALALGPNLNLPMQPDVVEQAWGAMQKAIALKGRVTERERDFIDALATRYVPDPDADRAALDAAYAEAMNALVAKYPDDLDAATLYAAAVMNTNPWDYWYRDGTPRPSTEIVMETLESVLDRDPYHAGANHYLIHVTEAFRPELGEAAADRLGGLMPGAGHLVHMPAHIYMRVGRYADSYAANEKAILADEGYITQCRAQGLYPLGYYPHNIHFLVWSAMFQGRSEKALTAARQVADKIPPQSEDNTWALYDAFRSQPMFVMVRFGMWDRILEEPRPAFKRAFMSGIWHYGRGMAYAGKGQPEAAERELNELSVDRALVASDETYYVGFGAAESLLTIAEEVLSGEIAARRGDYDAAIAHLERAVRLEDGLMYNEPPDWYFPVRHNLGAVLLEAGLPAEAEVVYWEDLRRNPRNGFSLFGLRQCLREQGKTGAADMIDERFAQAWGEADVELTSSRF